MLKSFVHFFNVISCSWCKYLLQSLFKANTFSGYVIFGSRGCIIIMHYIYICNIIISRVIIGRDNADHSIFLLSFSHRFVISQSLFRDLPVIFQSSFCHLYIIFLSSFCHYSVLVSFCLSVFLSVIAHLSSSNFI